MISVPKLILSRVHRSKKRSIFSTQRMKKVCLIKTFTSYDSIELWHYLSKLSKRLTRRAKPKRSLNYIIRAISSMKGKKPFLSFMYPLIKKTYPLFSFKKFATGRRINLLPNPLNNRKRSLTGSLLLKKALSKRIERGLVQKLKSELSDIQNNSGNIFKMKKEQLKQAALLKSNLRFLRPRFRFNVVKKKTPVFSFKKKIT